MNTNGRKWSFICTSHIYFLVGVKLGIGCLHLILLNIHEFHEDRHREGTAFLTDVNNMPINRMIFESKESIVKSAYCIREYVLHSPQ